MTVVGIRPETVKTVLRFDGWCVEGSKQVGVVYFAGLGRKERPREMLEG
jgi:hypothetical protein